MGVRIVIMRLCVHKKLCVCVLCVLCVCELLPVDCVCVCAFLGYALRFSVRVNVHVRKPVDARRRVVGLSAPSSKLLQTRLVMPERRSRQ